MLQPSFKIQSISDSVGAEELDALKFDGPALNIDDVDQVKIGAPPKMASIQEESFWKGPSELSAKANYASNAKGLFVQILVTDANMKAPMKWPGVFGSCVEFFFDFRNPARRADYPKFEKNVHQVIISPALSQGDATKVWFASEKYGTIDGLKAVSKRVDATSYAIKLFIPWGSVGGRPKNGIGVDVSVDNPAKSEPQTRKCQMVLFGDASNNVDPSNYGVGLLP